MDTFDLEKLSVFETKTTDEQKTDGGETPPTSKEETKTTDDDDKGEVTPPVETKDDKQDSDPEVNTFEYFAEQLGVKEFKVTDDYKDIDDLVKIAKTRIDELETQVQQYSSNTVIAELQEHLNQGGSIESFKQLQSLENEYSKIQLDYDNEKELEDFAKSFLKDIKGEDDEDYIQSFIDNKKDKGTLKDYVSANLEKLVKERDKEIQVARKEVEDSNKAQIEEQQKYFKDLDSAFEKINLEKDIAIKVKQLSLPDKSGKVGIYDVYNNLNAEQTALLHSFAYKVANNIPIEYKKDNVVKKPSIPVLAGKGGQPPSGTLGLSDFAKMSKK